MRKFAAFILATVTVMSLVIIPANARYFSDVNIGHWARESINYATDNGFIDPVSTYIFDPDGNFTRADVAKMIYRFEGSPAVATTTQFTDVSASSSYAKAVSWMKVNNIMGGTSDTTFEPNVGIKRQDLAVVFFRYGNYIQTKQREYLEAMTNGSTTLKERFIKTNVMEKQADITGFSDYSSITDYALEAVSWAVATKLITGEVGGLIKPKKIVVRETGAEFLKRFGIYVEGINFDRDVYGFVNSSSYFINKYSVLSWHKNILFYYLDLIGESKTYIQEYINSNTWTGSCRGMTTTVVLNKFGKLDLMGNFANNENKLSDFTDYDADLFSAINYYQVSQNASLIAAATTRYEKDDSLVDWKSDLNNLPSLVDENGIVILGITYLKSDGSSVGHSLALYDYKYTSNGFELYVYDPNSTTKVTLTLSYVIEQDNNGSSVSTSKLIYDAKEVLALRYISGLENMYHNYNRYDLDSYYNDFDAGTSATASVQLNDSGYTSTIVNNTTYLKLTLSGPFEVHNAEGEILSYNNGAFGGNMKVYSEWTANEGTNETLEYFVEVNNSDSFTIITK